MNVEQMKEASKTNSRFSGTFIISRCELKPFKQKSGCFMQCDLTDKTGSIRGIVWENAETHKGKIRNKMVATVTGETTRYNDNPQAVIKTINEAEKYDRSMFVPSLPEEDLKNIESDLEYLGGSITDPFYKKVWERVIILDTDISSKYKQCPGGVGDVHHAYIGGLMEHSHSMISTAKHITELPRSKNLNKELLLTGCLIHDIGKMEAYNWDIIIEMNDQGRLLHHVPLGVMIMNNLWQELYPGGSEEHYQKYLKLLHMIVSHHDSEDQGHRKPMIPEAVALARIDAMDASVVHSIDFSNNDDNHEEDTNWTRFCHLTGVRYFKPVVVERPPETPEVQEEPKHGGPEDDKVDLDGLF